MRENREFLMLAHTWRPGLKLGTGGWFLSEKLDGRRGYWDGGITRGLPKTEVPWANLRKDERYREEQIATGLWSRYGNVIHAPEEFLDGLPLIPLDGELFSPTISRQVLMSATQRLDPVGWDALQIKLRVFDVPPYELLFQSGRINNTQFEAYFDENKILPWIKRQTPDYWPKIRTFESTLALLNVKVGTNFSSVWVHDQDRLPNKRKDAEAWAAKCCEKITEKGGEGLILRHPHQNYAPYRSPYVLKVKPRDDAEGTVIGYVTGRETDKDSKFRGMLGALVLELDDGQRMELSGFNVPERVLVYRPQPDKEPDTFVARQWAWHNPGKECEVTITSDLFPLGSRVTFKFRGRTDDGIPMEAAYWRKYEDE
jgi:DNA ligase-1